MSEDVDTDAVGIRAQLNALQNTLSFVLATIAKDDPAMLERMHQRLVGHYVSGTEVSMREVRSLGLDEANAKEVLGRFEAASCATLDEVFGTAKTLT